MGEGEGVEEEEERERERWEERERRQSEEERRGVGDRLSPVVLLLGRRRTSSLGRPHPSLRGAWKIDTCTRQIHYQAS
jgi:hypothetical protein